MGVLELALRGGVNYIFSPSYTKLNCKKVIPKFISERNHNWAKIVSWVFISKRNEDIKKMQSILILPNTVEH